MGGERGSGRSMLAAWHDDDDDGIIPWNTKFTQHIEQIHGHVHTKIQEACDDNKIRLGETKL